MEPAPHFRADFEAATPTCWSATCSTSTPRSPLRADIDITETTVVKNIERRARKVQSSAEIAQVGTLSTNGDKAIGKMIADATKKVGNEGVITVEEAKTAETELSTSSRGGDAVRPGLPLALFHHQRRKDAFGARLPSPYSAHACRRICIDEVRKMPAMMAATSRSGHAVAVPHTASAATITMTLPMASLREQSQTDRTLASPSL
jgi:hypothetical protein